MQLIVVETDDPASTGSGRVTFLQMLEQIFCFWGVGLLGASWLCYRGTSPLGAAGFWLAVALRPALAAVPDVAGDPGP